MFDSAAGVELTAAEGEAFGEVGRGPEHSPTVSVVCLVHGRVGEGRYLEQ